MALPRSESWYTHRTAAVGGAALVQSEIVGAVAGEQDTICCSGQRQNLGVGGSNPVRLTDCQHVVAPRP